MLVPFEQENPSPERIVDLMEVAGVLRLSSATVHQWAMAGTNHPGSGSKRASIKLSDAAQYVYEMRRKLMPRLLNGFPELRGMFPDDGDTVSVGELVHEFDLIKVNTGDLDEVRKGMDIAGRGLEILSREMRLQTLAGELVKRSEVEAQQRGLISLLEDNLGPPFIQQLATAIFYLEKPTEGELFKVLNTYVSNAVNGSIEDLHAMFGLSSEAAV